MMASRSDAERLLDENFIALDESNPFDPLDDHGFGDLKFRRKSGFSFSSSWRKPKIGRRKSKANISKNIDSYDMTISDDFTRGKYVKGRESFESFASVPLSEFDEAKDMLPFLNIRNDTPKRNNSTKEKTAFNPKMFLSQPPVNRTEIKNKFKKERTLNKMDDEEPFDVFKAVHNNSDKFDAFQILPKESSGKVKSKEQVVQKQKEEYPEDQYDKENSSSFYGGDLYQDHGPILSSLSEDTSMHSDSVRGEQFLEDEPKWNPLLNTNFDEEEEDTWYEMNSRKSTQQAESVKSNRKVETTVGSFSDRMKLFQSKDTGSNKSNSTKSSASSQITDILGPKVTNKKVEVTSAVEKSEEEIDAELENLDKLVASVFLDSGNKATEEPNQSSIVTTKSSVKKYSNKFERNFERIKTYQMNNEPRVSTSSYQENKNKFGINKFGDESRKKILVDGNSEKVKSSVVDLSMISSSRNQARSVPESATKDPSLALEVQKVEPKKTWKESGTSRKSDRSVHSSYSHHTNYRSSISSQKTASVFEGKKFEGRTSKPWEIERKTSIENDSEISHATEASQSVEKVINLDQPVDISSAVSHQTPQAPETKDKPRDSFLAAAMLFGGKVEPSKNKFGRKFGANTRKLSDEQAVEEKKETTEPHHQSNIKDIENDESVVKNMFEFGGKKSIESIRSIESVRSKFEFGGKKSIESVRSIESVKSKAQNFTTKPSVVRKSFTTKPSIIRKSSLGSVSQASNVGNTKTFLKTGKPSVDAPIATSLESDKKVDPTPTSNESTANTSISSLTYDSAPSKSFAQQSANIFGVTLKKRTGSAPVQKETVATKKSIVTTANVEKSESRTILIDTDTQIVKPGRDAVENKLPETGKQEISEKVFNARKTSTSSVSIQSEKPVIEVTDPKPDETSTVVEEQPKMNEKDQVNPLQEETKSDTSVQKVNPVSLPRQTSSRSISNRLKMFEKAASRNRKSYIQQREKTEPPMCSDSPKSIGTSESLASVDDLSVATKRRETSGSSSLGTKRRSTAGSDFSIATKRRDTSESEITTVTGKKDNDTSDRRDTLKSNRGTGVASSSFGSQPKSFEKSSKVLEKPIVLPITKGTNDSTSTGKQESNAQPQKSLSKEDAYSMRRKFFENLDRKRLQASMSRPLVTQAEPTPAKDNDVAENTETATDEAPCEDTDLPMFVEVEEDFMLKDNISTCLSASESRSVVCKPDALLYSVSQKAIAMMSVKAESSSMRSYTRTYGTQNKGTIDHGIKLNREESLARFRNRFSNKMATNNEKDIAESSQVEDEKERELSSDIEPENNARPSEFSQRFNRFEKAKTMTPATSTEELSSDVSAASTVNDVQDDSENHGLSKSSEEKIPANDDDKNKPESTGISSMSIRERRKLFESKFGNGSDKSEPKVPVNARKSSVSVVSRSSASDNGSKSQPSDVSEMTPLEGEPVALQPEPSESEPSEAPRNRASSTSMSTLEYSLQSSSSSKPSDSSKRESSASSSANQQLSAAQLYRNALKSANRSNHGRKDADLRCF